MTKLDRAGRLELVASLFAAVLGVGGVVFLLLGPVTATQRGAASSGGTVTQGSTSTGLLGSGLDPLTATVLAIAILAAVGIGLGGLLHARLGWRGGRILLAISTTALLGVAIAGALTIGVFLLPSTALGIVALAAGTPPLPNGRWPHP